MTNRRKGILGISMFVLSSLEQTLCAFFGRFFEQPIDPIVLLGIVGLVYGIQKFKLPNTEVANGTKFVKYMLGSLFLGIGSIFFGIGASCVVITQSPSLSTIGLVVTLKTLASLAWCLSTIGALLSLRDVFLMK